MKSTLMPWVGLESLLWTVLSEEWKVFYMKQYSNLMMETRDSRSFMTYEVT
jgi:hypothetical protein